MPVVVAGAAGAGATGGGAAGGAAGGGGLAGSGLVPVNPVLDLRALGTPANHLMKAAEGQAAPFDPKSHMYPRMPDPDMFLPDALKTPNSPWSRLPKQEGPPEAAPQQPRAEPARPDQSAPPQPRGPADRRQAAPPEQPRSGAEAPDGPKPDARRQADGPQIGEAPAPRPAEPDAPSPDERLGEPGPDAPPPAEPTPRQRGQAAPEGEQPGADYPTIGPATDRAPYYSPELHKELEEIARRELQDAPTSEVYRRAEGGDPEAKRELMERASITPVFGDVIDWQLLLEDLEKYLKGEGDLPLGSGILAVTPGLSHGGANLVTTLVGRGIPKAIAEEIAEFVLKKVQPKYKKFVNDLKKKRPNWTDAEIGNAADEKIKKWLSKEDINIGNRKISVHTEVQMGALSGQKDYGPDLDAVFTYKQGGNVVLRIEFKKAKPSSGTQKFMIKVMTDVDPTTPNFYVTSIDVKLVEPGMGRVKRVK